MRLVERVLEHDREGIRCAARVQPGTPLSGKAGAPAVVGVEMAAQAAALHQALCIPEEGDGARLRPGYLVGVRDLRMRVARLPPGEELEITLRRRGSAPPLAIYAAQVALSGTVLVEGTISIYAATVEDPSSAPATRGQSSAKQNH